MQATLTLAHCSFTNNSATQGGALFINAAKVSKSEVTITKASVFAGNSATDGSAVYVTAPLTRALVALSVEGNSTFLSNVATGGNGAIFLSGSGAVTIVDESTFTSNVASNGGAVYALATPRLNVTSSTFQRNRASRGGAVALVKLSVAQLIGNTFAQNSADYGSAFYSSGSVAITVSKNTFSRNVAQYGGTSYWESSALLNWPLGWRENTFVGNVGLFGEGWASQPVNLSTTPSVIVDTSKNSVPPIQVFLVDIFGNAVTNTSYHASRAVKVNSDHCYSNLYNVAGRTLAPLGLGYGEFRGIIATCYPTGYLTTTYSTSLSYSSELAGSTKVRDVAVDQLWSFSNCVSGQVLKVATCFACPKGTCNVKGAPLTEGGSKAAYALTQLQSLGDCKAAPANSIPTKTMGDQVLYSTLPYPTKPFTVHIFRLTRYAHTMPPLMHNLNHNHTFLNSSPGIVPPFPHHTPDIFTRHTYTPFFPNLASVRKLKIL